MSAPKYELVYTGSRYELKELISCIIYKNTVVYKDSEKYIVHTVKSPNL